MERLNNDERVLIHYLIKLGFFSECLEGQVEGVKHPLGSESGPSSSV